MVSIKLAAVLLALVCLLQMQEGSAFLVKRDTTEAGSQDLTFEKIGDAITKAFNDAKEKISSADFQGQLKSLNDQLEKFSSQVKAKLDEGMPELQKAIGTSGS